MPKRPINPAEVYDEGRFLAGESDPFNPRQPKKIEKPKKKTAPSACGQGSCSADNIRNYN